MTSKRSAASISTLNSTSGKLRVNWPSILCLLIGLIQYGNCSRSQAAPASTPLYDWDFSPSVIKVGSAQSFDAFVTIRNLPNSPANLLGSRWYALDMYPGAAMDPDGPYRIRLFTLAVSSMNLAPGQSFTTKFAQFTPRYAPSLPYNGLLIAGGYMRFLGPNNEFLDVGGLDKQLRVAIIPEPAAAALLSLGTLALVSWRRTRRQQCSTSGRYSAVRCETWN